MEKCRKLILMILMLEKLNLFNLTILITVAVNVIMDESVLEENSSCKSAGVVFLF